MNKYIFITAFILSSIGSNAQNVPNGVSTTTPPVVTDNLPLDFSSGIKINWVRTSTICKPVTDPAVAKTLALPDMITMTSYFDGIARGIQTVVKQGGRDGGDVVSLTNYDANGRSAIQPLPYVYQGNNDGSFKLNGNSMQQYFYNTPIMTSDIAAGDTYNPYSKTQFDDTSLFRSIKQLAPGASKVGSNKGVVTKVMLNDAVDDVEMWQFTSVGAPPARTGVYADNTLYVTETTDEAGKRTREYKDREGKLILAKTEVGTTAGNGHAGWLCTYNVYDDLNRLRTVIPPKAIAAIQSSGWNLTQSILDNLCYSYDYDGKGRQIWKKLPGVAASNTIYDQNDRPIFTQDGILAGTNEWFFTKFDVFGRPIITGKYLNTSSFSSATLTAMMNGTMSTNNNFITFLLTPIATNSLTPTNTIYTDGQIYSLTFYDNYQYTPTYSYDNTSIQNLPTGPNAVTATQSNNVKGFVTGGYINIMEGNNVTGNWESFVMYYDALGRMIQRQGKNNKAGMEITSNLYDFSGKLLSCYSSQKNPTVASGQIDNVYSTAQFIYDNQGRRKNTFVKINDEPSFRRLNNVNYNVMGSRPANKTFGTNAEYQAYQYRMWGALESINKGFCVAGGSGNFWGEIINYDYGFSQTDATLPSGWRWRLKGSNNIQRAYGYTYDPAGRLTSADYTQDDGNGGGWLSTATNYSAKNIKYDENGNLTHMEQWGTKQGYSSPFLMDNMDYNYKNSNMSNQLDGVKDNVLTDYGLGEFTEVNTNAQDYSYDNNGNATKDNNKDITSISYTYFNKPYVITFTNNRTIKFTYDAAGTLLTKQINDNGVLTNIDYLGGLEYQNGVLTSIQHEEGRIRPVMITGSNGSHQWQYEYDFLIKDHIGNVRSVITEEPDANWWNPAPDPSSPPAQMVYNPTNPGNGNTYTGFTVGEVNYRVSNELSQATIENATFSNVDATRADKIGSTNPNDVKSTELNPDNNTSIGPSIMLRVMAGDQIEVNTSAYYEDIPGSDYTSNFTPEQLANALVTALSGSGGYQSLNESGLAPDLVSNPVNQSRMIDALQIMKNENTADGQRPQAFLNYIMLDDDLQVVDDLTGFVQTTVSGNWNGLNVPRFSTTRNGYIIIFLSNESRMSVQFDNLNVTHYKGTLKEESHYYPYGLTLTTKAVTNYPDNNYLLTGKQLNKAEFSNGTGLNWYDFGARQFDPQIGAWHVADPLAAGTPSIGNYLYCNSNPVVFTDPTGMRHEKLKYYAFNDYPGYEWQAGRGGGGARSVNDVMFDMLRTVAEMDAIEEDHKGVHYDMGSGKYMSGNIEITVDQAIAYYQGTTYEGYKVYAYMNGGENNAIASAFGWNRSNDNHGIGLAYTSDFSLNNSISIGINIQSNILGNVGKKVTLPLFEDLWRNYPLNADGTVGHPVKDKNVVNQCAIRMSFTILEAGGYMPNTSKFSKVQGYMSVAGQWAEWMAQNYGLPVAGSVRSMNNKYQVMSSNDFYDGGYANMTGIIYFDFRNVNVTGHIDLWNGEASKGIPYRDWLTVWDVRVWFWPLK